MAQHNTVDEIVAGTHGRSLWIADVAALRQYTSDAMAKDSHLYKPGNVTVWRREPSRGNGGPREYTGQNPSSSAQIVYHLKKKQDNVKVRILDVSGTMMREMDANGDAGFHTMSWDLRRQRSQSQPKAEVVASTWRGPCG